MSATRAQLVTLMERLIESEGSVAIKRGGMKPENWSLFAEQPSDDGGSAWEYIGQGESLEEALRNATAGARHRHQYEIEQNEASLRELRRRLAALDGNTA